jgi:hypothetical protein
MDWVFGSEIGRDFDFLRSLYNCLNSLRSLFMKAFILTASCVFQFFHFVVLSSIRDMLIRNPQKGDRTYLFGELDRNISGRDREKRMTEGRINERLYIQI